MSKKNIFKKRMLTLFVLCGLCMPVITYATSDNTTNNNIESKDNHQDQNENNSTSNESSGEDEKEKVPYNQITNVRHKRRMRKLRKDLNEFKELGSKGISSDNMFYPTAVTGLTAQEIDAAMRGTPLYGTGSSFNKTEQYYGISALYFAAMANHESYYGQSNIAKSKNNLFGFNAQDDDPYNKASEYESLDDCIMQVGKKIKYLYLTSNGEYFEGYSSRAMAVHYASDSQWPTKVDFHMVQIAEKILSYYGY